MAKFTTRLRSIYYPSITYALPVHYPLTACFITCLLPVGYCLVSTWRIHVHYMFTTCLLFVLLLVYELCTICLLPTCHYMFITHYLCYYMFTASARRVACLPRGAIPCLAASVLGLAMSDSGANADTGRVPTATPGQWELPEPPPDSDSSSGAIICLGSTRQCGQSPRKRRRAVSADQGGPLVLAAVVSYSHGRWSDELRIDGSDLSVSLGQWRHLDGQCTQPLHWPVCHGFCIMQSWKFLDHCDTPSSRAMVDALRKLHRRSKCARCLEQVVVRAWALIEPYQLEADAMSNICTSAKRVISQCGQSPLIDASTP